MDKLSLQRKAENKRYLTHFNIAGFEYYQGAEAFTNLTIGTILTLEREADNRYDENAVAIYLNNDTQALKLGYIPKAENRFIAEILRCGVGHVFEVRIQRIDANEHPNQQVNVVVHTVKPE